MQGELTERARRLFIASEALAFGYGGIAAASRATGRAARGIGRGIAEVRAIEGGAVPARPPPRSRRPGGGRKKATEKAPTWLTDVQALVESTTRGDPESPRRWTARSPRHLVAALGKLGHRTSLTRVARLLRDELGSRRQATRKRLEGAQHPDRRAQFEHLNAVLRRQLAAHEPAISVDTKTKERVGPYKNAGRALRAQGDPDDVNVHDVVGPTRGRAAPYGVSDLRQNEAWVSGGVSHDTAEVAGQAIRTWWNERGAPTSPAARSLVMTADGGGRHGARLRLWKIALQGVVDERGFPVPGCHLPPGTSTGNTIEHRRCSFITHHWRGTPLGTHQVIVNLIAAATTTTGLVVRRRLDDRMSPTGRRVSDGQRALVHLEPPVFHGEWNYTIHPTGIA